MCLTITVSEWHSIVLGNKYGEYLNLKNGRVKNALPIIKLKIIPIILNILILSFLPVSETVLEIL